ncbi:reverse transcriptase domain-containing protein [Clostridium butyricum]|uniref:reverse transcriptase domain-containing protein n=1 Tax=Clostridium butyricum TaxID=1492 RepID=UPI0005EAFDB4|nr:reverse transcriptase domain-containing protein [Clostridium butyricum]
MNLDEKLFEIFTEENFKQEFLNYKIEKTDQYTNSILIPMGTDGVDWMTFEKNLDKLAEHTCKRVREGQYFFLPFREKEVPKPPYIDLKAAKRNNKTRVLSIAVIRDVIFQKLLYKVIEEYCEEKFKDIDDISFAYRSGKSTQMVINKIYKLFTKGYYYILNGDIKKFYDEIPHDKLLDSIEKFFGVENKSILTLLKRFISADKVSYNDYKGNVKKYYRKKPNREIRAKGIPQGGVLSGIVANIYMYDFDKEVKELLRNNYKNIRYFRYADDFVIITQHNEYIDPIYSELYNLLNKKGLHLHSIGEKTKKLDVSNIGKEKLEFLGFEVSPKGIRVKRDNINKFKFRIKDKIDNTKIYKRSPEKGLSLLIKKINFKILGNAAFETEKNICEVYGKIIQERNWMSHYKTITDVRQLKNLDRWIRKQIYTKYYYCIKTRLKKESLNNSELKSLKKVYYVYKKKNFKENFCNCRINGLQESLNSEMH